MKGSQGAYAENAFRPHAVGRKNYLFVGSPRGGKACAMAMTFLQSAKAVGANPHEYLHDIYDRIMGHPARRLHELLPAAWLRSRQTPSRTWPIRKRNRLFRRGRHRVS